MGMMVMGVVFCGIWWEYDGVFCGMMMNHLEFQVFFLMIHSRSAYCNCSLVMYGYGSRLWRYEPSKHVIYLSIKLYIFTYIYIWYIIDSQWHGEYLGRTYGGFSDTNEFVAFLSPGGPTGPTHLTILFLGYLVTLPMPRCFYGSTIPTSFGPPWISSSIITFWSENMVK